MQKFAFNVLLYPAVFIAVENDNTVKFGNVFQLLELIDDETLVADGEVGGRVVESEREEVVVLPICHNKGNIIFRQHVGDLSKSFFYIGINNSKLKMRINIWLNCRCFHREHSPLSFLTPQEASLYKD